MAPTRVTKSRSVPGERCSWARVDDVGDAAGVGARRRALLAALLGALLAVACGGDRPAPAPAPSLACGDRTVQQGSECVAERDGTPPAVRCGPGTTLVAGECVPTTTPDHDGLIDRDIDLSGSGYLPACIDAPAVARSNGSCVVVDALVTYCNPVSNEGCSDVGGHCTYEAFSGAFMCVGQPADRQSCESCSTTFFDNCAPGFSCQGGLYSCQRYCCDDGDCGQGAECVLQPPLTFGICQAQRSDIFAHLGGSGEGGWSGEGGFGGDIGPGEGGFGEGGWSGDGGAGGREAGAGGATGGESHP